MPLFFGIVTRNYGIVPACCRHTYRVKSSCAAVTVAICCKSSLAVVLSRCWWWWHRLLQHMRCLFIFLWFVVAKVICSCKAAIRGTEIGVPRCTAVVSVAVYMLPAGWWLTGAGGCCHRSAPILAAGSWRLALGLKCDMCAPFALLFCFEYELYTSNFPLSFAHILCRYWCYDCCRSKLWFPQTRRSPLAIRWPHATAIIWLDLSVCACCCCWHHLFGVPQLRLVVVAAFENCQLNSLLLHRMLHIGALFIAAIIGETREALWHTHTHTNKYVHVWLQLPNADMAHAKKNAHESVAVNAVNFGLFSRDSCSSVLFALWRADISTATNCAGWVAC